MEQLGCSPSSRLSLSPFLFFFPAVASEILLKFESDDPASLLRNLPSLPTALGVESRVLRAVCKAVAVVGLLVTPLMFSCFPACSSCSDRAGACQARSLPKALLFSRSGNLSRTVPLPRAPYPRLASSHLFSFP